VERVVAPLTIYSNAVTLKLGDKEYEISWGERESGGKGILILSSEAVEVVERSDKGYWLIVS